MTGQQAIDSFKLKFDRWASFAARGYEDDEILSFLNDAQDRFIKNRVFGKNFQPPAIEDNQKRVVDISPLLDRGHVTSGFISVDTYFGSKARKVLILNIASGRVLYVLGVDLQITRTNPTATSEFYRCEPIKTEDAERFLINQSNRAHFLYPKYFQTHNYIHVMTDYYTSAINACRFSFVKKPYPITASSQEFDGTYGATHMSLNDFVHDEFVDMAVKEGIKAASQEQRLAAELKEEQMTRE